MLSCYDALSEGRARWERWKWEWPKKAVSDGHGAEFESVIDGGGMNKRRYSMQCSSSR